MPAYCHDIISSIQNEVYRLTAHHCIKTAGSISIRNDNIFSMQGADYQLDI